MQPASPSALDHADKNAAGDATWRQKLFASIWGFFSNEPSGGDTEADAVEAWVGVRKGRGRCRSVGEVR
ncbi:hypothetical protein N7490_003755 [Penicillium lividum]|nr:hypothetical protein N7490_003755 [Penicillium lividum]